MDSFGIPDDSQLEPVHELDDEDRRSLVRASPGRLDPGVAGLLRFILKQREVADSVNSLSMQPTPYPELNNVLVELVSGIMQILGSHFTGAYLQGSFAVGDFDEWSDVDFVVVLEDELTSEQVNSLQALHGLIFRLESYWAKHLEGSYFPSSILRKPITRSSELWYLDNGSSNLIRSDHCNTILVRWIIREKGVVLAGPPPLLLVDPISTDMLRREISGEILMWGQHILDDPSLYANCFYQHYIVLNFARMLHDLHRGYPGSKREGAEWAKSTLDPRWSDIIDSTWNGRPKPEEKIRQTADPAAYDRTLQFVQYIMSQCRAY